jgi:signal transduction histidine kinase
MKLKNKIVFFIIFICLLFAVSYFFLFRVVLTAPIEDQKWLQGQKIIAGVERVLDDEQLRIFTVCEDWAMWDTMYDFVSRQTDKVQQDLGPELMLKDADLSLLLAVDKEKSAIISHLYHNSQKRYIPLSEFQQKQGNLWRYVLKTFAAKNTISGLIGTKHGVLLVVSSPILKSDNSGPQNGRLLMGRFIDGSIEKKIAATIRENTQFVAPVHEDNLYTFTDHDDHMLIRYNLQDVWKKPILTVRVQAQKKLFLILEDATQLFFYLLIAGFLLFGIIFYIMAHYIVVRRVKNLATKTDNIVSFDDLSLRIKEQYRDEISHLCNNMNKMLHRLQTENSRRQEIEQMLLLNEKLIFLGKVTARIAHEVNNPLFAIDNALKHLETHLPKDNAKLTHVFELLGQELKRVRTITNDMHQFTIRQLETFRPADLGEIINHAIKVIQWSKQLKETIVHFNGDGKKYPLLCNPDTLQQVFMNLLINAIEAMQGNGRIHINIDQEKNNYKISVNDNGPGINDQIKPLLFAPFQTTKEGQGTGLGLYISRNIIVNHKGTITLADNKTPGAGFIIRLPKPKVTR